MAYQGALGLRPTVLRMRKANLFVLESIGWELGGG